MYFSKYNNESYPVLSGQELQRNFKKYVTAQDKPGFWTVTKPIPVYKKVTTYAASVDTNISFCPHRDLDAIRTSFRKHAFSLYGVDKDQAIANLIIPVGATVHFDVNKGKKMRASQAECHSIVRISDKESVLYGMSKYDMGFIYLSGQRMCETVVVKPTKRFSVKAGTCESGVHAFLELYEALRY